MYKYYGGHCKVYIQVNPLSLTVILYHANFLPVDHYVVVQSLSHVQLSVTPWTAARQAFLSFTVYWSFLKFMSIELDYVIKYPVKTVLNGMENLGLKRHPQNHTTC